MTRLQEMKLIAEGSERNRLDVQAKLDAAISREAALREELAKQVERANDFASKLTGAQQRLTVAERGLKTIIKRCQAGWSTEAIELEAEEALEDVALKPAAQHQGEPVAYTTAGMLEIAKRLPLTGRIGAKATKDERWNIPLFLGQAEHPATVAVVMPERKGANHKDWREWTHEEIGYNKALDDVARLNGVKP